MSARATLERLSALAGLVLSYRDAWGGVQRMGEDTQRALLGALGIDAGSADAVESSVRAIEEAPWRRPLEPVQVTPYAPGRRLRVSVTLPATLSARTLAWRFEREGGEAVAGEARIDGLPLLEGRIVDGRAVERRALDVPLAPGPGYHSLRLTVPGPEQSGAAGASLPVIVHRARCHQPASRQRRVWGIGMQLYGLRSERNWGLGDFTDLAKLVAAAARLGADAVGLNPLHALFPGNPARISPYSPSHRSFLSMLYIDVQAVDDFADCEPAKDLLRSATVRKRLDAVRKAPLVQYSDVLALKLEALDRLYRSFCARHLVRGAAASERGGQFRRFQSAGGTALERLAVFQALSEHFGPATPWWDWPQPFRDCASPAVAEFAAGHRDRVEFFQYLQWQADRQLRAAAQAARDAGMAIGLYHDLALAADRAGAETWINRRLMAHEASLGAPPDDWNLRGQDWGVPPYDPRMLRAAAYAPFSAILRANMGYGGALRIDHVMGLERTYWIPRGAGPRDGGYVRSPAADLIGVLALESARQRCMVIGEDLGTLPEGFPRRLRAAGILSCRLLYFERDTRGGFLPPRRYPAPALVSIGTHDLATLPGYWRGRDLHLRSELGLYPSRVSECAARGQRTRDRLGLVRAFKHAGVLPQSFPDRPGEFTFDLVLAAYRFLARSPARLLLVHVEDALGLEDQPNMPGTVDEHPNWRRKLPLDIAALERDPRLRALANAIGAERRGRSGA